MEKNPQPILCDEFGSKFLGKAQTATGDIWWYKKRESDGTVTTVLLRPINDPELSQPQIP